MKSEIKIPGVVNLPNKQVVHCSNCTRSIGFTTSSHSPMGPIFLKRKTQQRGWEWSSRGKHICPSCIAARRASSSSKPAMAEAFERALQSVANPPEKPAAAPISEKKTMEHNTQSLKAAEPAKRPQKGGRSNMLDEPALLEKYKEFRRQGKTLGQVARIMGITQNATYLHLNRFGMKAGDYRVARFPDRPLSSPGTHELKPLSGVKQMLPEAPRGPKPRIEAVQSTPKPEPTSEAPVARTGVEAHAERIANMAVDLGIEVERLRAELKARDDRGLLGQLRAAKELLVLIADLKHLVVPATATDSQIVVLMPRITAGMVRRADGLVTQIEQKLNKS